MEIHLSKSYSDSGSREKTSQLEYFENPRSIGSQDHDYGDWASRLSRHVESLETGELKCLLEGV